jgi:hypothetical protein
MIAADTESGRRSDAARGEVGWLGFAATPMFAVMALLTCASGNDAAMLLCSGGHGISPLSGMAPMYVLMSTFHSMPWLNLISRWRDAATKKAGSRPGRSAQPERYS